MNILQNVVKIFTSTLAQAALPPVSNCGTNYAALIDKVIEHLKEANTTYDIVLSKFDSGKQVMALNPEQSLDMLTLALMRLAKSKDKEAENWNAYRFDASAEDAIARGMLKRKLPYTKEHITLMLSILSEAKKLASYLFPVAPIIKAVEGYYADGVIDDTNIKNLLEKILDKLKVSPFGGSEERRIADRIVRLLHTDGKLILPLTPGEAWSDQAIKDVSSANQEQQQVWCNLLIACQNSKASKPNKKWLAEAQSYIEQIGWPSFSDSIFQWFNLLDKPKTIPLTRRSEWDPDPNLTFNESNADILKGLVWCCSLKQDKEFARLLTKVGLIAFKKIPWAGARSVRVGNAVIYSLATMRGRDGLYQLALLKVKLKSRQALNMLDKYLTVAAEREGFTISELSEMGVPSFGLDDVGKGEEPLGDYIGLVKVNGFNNVELTWRKPDGKVQKSVPAAVNEHFSTDLKELKGNIKDLKSMLSVQKERLEKLFLLAPTWQFEVWNERYHQHPVVGIFTRKLIWKFSLDGVARLAIYHKECFRDVNGNDISDFVQQASVAIWHPIDSSVEEIRAWRDFLIINQITQPFKQAHREVYLLTDAERATNTYSNRFASHIIKQHQFSALATTRGWRYTLQGAWDGGMDEIANIRLEQYNLYAEFWVNGIGEYGESTSESGIFLYVTTDQVRFYQVRPDIDSLNELNIEKSRPMPLEQVPALVFSEVLRDVDLYVGVCSVGNDPEWADGGANGQYREYWHSVSFGDLSASAETRKEILQNLVPKLKIGKQCRFIDKFLVVEGKRRIYKIHLGSGNIQMEPNNQYLCIVGDAKKTSNDPGLFLPFEGDKMLSLILSKAALLAADDKIKDSSINSQIDHK